MGKFIGSIIVAKRGTNRSIDETLKATHNRAMETPLIRIDIVINI